MNVLRIIREAREARAADCDAGCRLFRAAAIVAALVLGASWCADARAEVAPAERAWYVLHALDVAQTMNATGPHSSCVEAHPITRRLIGERPSDAQVVAWGAGMALAHYGISRALDGRYPRLYRAWQYVRITETGIAVVSNHRAGARLVGPQRCDR